MVSKITTWIALNGASVFGLVQAVLKFVKELLTLTINILFPIIPPSKFKDIVIKVRDVVNKIDEQVEKLKGKLIK